jgi:diphthamide synthase (EF-2-diphthine--ammonia ligase)
MIVSLQYSGRTVSGENFDQRTSARITKGIDPCENGEFHTLVLNCPLFSGLNCQHSLKLLEKIIASLFGKNNFSRTKKMAISIAKSISKQCFKIDFCNCY